MKNDTESNPVEIFAGTPVESGILKSILEDAGIMVFLLDDLMGSIAPWQVSAGGAGAVKVVISSLDLERARPIVEEFNNNLRSGT